MIWMEYCIQCRKFMYMLLFKINFLTNEQCYVLNPDVSCLLVIENFLLPSTD